MSDILDLSILENLSEGKTRKDFDSLGKSILKQIKEYLELEPYFENIEFRIKEDDSYIAINPDEIFSLGTYKIVKKNIVSVEIYREFEKFYSFILLREIYNIFVPREIQNYESVQLVINQIILVDLMKHRSVNEWRSLIRGNIEQHSLISTGINRLDAFDRISNFFKLIQTKFNPTRFFFHYIRENVSLLSNKLESREFDIHVMFFEEFERILQKEIVNDEIVETLRCLIKIFYETKRHRNLLSYKSYFQKFKENGQLITDLSLRKFAIHMEWIKNSIIAPSYTLNYNAMNLVYFSIFIGFNPLLHNNKIFKITEKLPFLITSQISRKSFGLDIYALFAIPKPYLKDLIGFISRLENAGYITIYYHFISESILMKNNLNTFKEYAQKQILLNPSHPEYEKRNEIETLRDFGKEFYKFQFDLLDFIILDRIQWYSVTGLGFERRNDVLQSLKSDIFNATTSERAIIKDLKRNLEIFHRSPDLKKEILRFIEINKHLGFFYINTILENYETVITLMLEYLKIHPEVKNLLQMQTAINTKKIISLIDENILLNNIHLIKNILEDIFSQYFKSKTLFKSQVEKYRLFYRLFSLFSHLKIYNLVSITEIIKQEDIFELIFKKKEERLKNSYEKFKLYQITSQKIDSILDRFLENIPPIIIPCLVNTLQIPHYINDYIVILIVESLENMEILKRCQNFFPRGNIVKNRKGGIIYVEIHIPFLTHDEKGELYSILYNNFKADIIFANTFLYLGYFSAFSIKNFYDFERNEFFYTKDLFEQYFLYVKKMLGNELKPFRSIPRTSQGCLWSDKKNFMNLVKNVNDRVIKETNDYSITYLNRLMQFNSNLKENLINITRFKEINQKEYFKNYIKAIKFIPAFQNFGFSQYFLYIYPFDMRKFDLKLLLLNSFQSIKFPACINDSNPFLIKYIMPYGRPNKSYLNRIVKSDKIIREYCLFSIKKIFAILHFDYNLDPEGWVYDTDKFKIYMQNILFNPNYKISNPKVREFEIAEKSVSSHLGPSNHEYQVLTQIYRMNSLDVKSHLGTRNYKTVNAILELLKKNLIFPYLKLKNLNLHNKIVMILPNIKPETVIKLVKIFSFFNYGFIYEIQGEYFIQGFSEEKRYENGLMIKLYLPRHKHHEFIGLFDLLFEYFEINDYLILTDLVNGDDLLKSIYGSLNFLDSYNPLKNLVWNDKDKIWMNHKLFTKKFEKIYPDLNFTEDN